MGARLLLAPPLQRDFLVEEELLPRPLQWPPRERRGVRVFCIPQSVGVPRGVPRGLSETILFPRPRVAFQITGGREKSGLF